MENLIFIFKKGDFVEINKPIQPDKSNFIIVRNDGQNIIPQYLKYDDVLKSMENIKNIYQYIELPEAYFKVIEKINLYQQR